MTFYVFFLHFCWGHNNTCTKNFTMIKTTQKKKKQSPKSPKFFLRTKLFPHAVVNVAPICISAIILFLLTSILLKITLKKKYIKLTKNTKKNLLHVMVFLLSAHVVVNI